MVDNITAKTYDLRVVSHIKDSFVKARPRYFKFRCPNCYLISNGMGGDNETVIGNFVSSQIGKVKST